MTYRKAFLIAFLIIAAVIIASPRPEPLQAQGTWTYHCDFKLYSGSWQPSTRLIIGSPNSDMESTAGWTLGSGWREVNAAYESTLIDFHVVATGTSIESYTLEMEETCGGTQSIGLFVDNDDSAVNGTTGSSNQNLGCINGVTTHFRTETLSLSGITRILFHAAAYYSAPYLTEITVSGTGTNPFGVEDCGDEFDNPDWIRPLRQTDEDPEIFDLTTSVERKDEIIPDWFYFPVYTGLWQADINQIQAWSYGVGDKVHAAAGGTIQSVERLTWADCGFGMYQYDNLIDKNVLFVPYKTEEPAPCYVAMPDLDSPLDTHYDQFWRKYYLDPTEVYKVVLSLGGGESFAPMDITYLVKDAPLYVVAGDVVYGGCVLGTTIPVTSEPINYPPYLQIIGSIAGGIAGVATGPVGLIATVVSGGINLVGDWIFPPQLDSPATTRGYSSMMPIVTSTSNSINITGWLSEYPTSDTPCSQTEEFRACQNSPGARFENNGAGWSVDYGNPIWLNPGVSLDPGVTISMGLVLDDAQPQTVALRAKGDGGPGEIRVQLGQESQRQALLDETSTFNLVYDPLEPDAGTISTLVLHNVGDVPIEIRSVCVIENGAAGDGCTFSGVEDWTGSAGAQMVDSAWNVGNDGTISHTASLVAGDYQLTVYGYWWYDYPATLTDSATISYEFPASAGFNQIGDAIPGVTQIGLSAIEQSETITIAADDEDTLTLKVNITGDANGLKITKVCLKPESDGTGEDPPFVAECTYMPAPTGNDFGQWILFHWHNLNRVLKCDLIVLLNKIWKAIRDFMTMVGWAIRWGMGSIDQGNTWMGSNLFPWLNGHFRNMAYGSVTTIEQGGGIGIWDVLLALIQGVFGPLVGMVGQVVGLLIGVITQAADLIFSVLTGAIVLVLGIISKVFQLLGLATQLLGGLLTAYNSATPTAIPGIPLCNNPHESMVCAVVWITDNTVFRPGSTGAFFIPVMVAIMTIHLILWVIGEIKHLVMTTAATS